MQGIDAWLQDQDYCKGVALYRKHGSDAVLLSIFDLPETSFTRKKLAAALELMSGNTIVKSSKIEAANPQQASKQVTTPKPVLELIQKRSQYHESLYYTTSMADRHKISLAILAIGSKLDGWYDQGQLPSGEVENELQELDIALNAWDLHQTVNNNMTYITKNRKREDKLGEVSRRTRQNTAIETRLKSMNYE
jgi:hypothetical protein